MSVKTVSDFSYMCEWLLVNKYEPANIPEPSILSFFGPDDIQFTHTYTHSQTPVYATFDSVLPNFKSVPILPHIKLKKNLQTSYTTKRVSSRCVGKVEPAGNHYRDLLEKASNAERELRLLNAQKRIYKDLPDLIPVIINLHL